MNKILRTTIVFLLIPSLVFAQIPQYKGNEPSVKQTDLSQVWNALNTEVGQQIVSYVETTVGSVDLEHAKAFAMANGEIAFVPIKSFSRVLAALCYRQLEDGSEYLFLITYNTTQKSVAFTFPSGRIYVMKSSKVTESINPDAQFQQYDDLQNKVRINEGGSDLFVIVCLPVCGIIQMISRMIGFMVNLICSDYICAIIVMVSGFFFAMIAPVLLNVTVYAAYPSNLNLNLLSILFTLYYYSCYQLYNQHREYGCMGNFL